MSYFPTSIILIANKTNYNLSKLLIHKLITPSLNTSKRELLR